MNFKLLVIAASGLLVAPLSAKDPCTGLSSEPIIPGGNETVTWSSLRRAEGGLIVYEQTVKNESDHRLTDVDWPVAYFYRRYIDPKESICERTPVPGAATTHSGDLYYSSTASASKSCQTNPYAPEKPAIWPFSLFAGVDKLPQQSTLVSGLLITVPSKTGFAVCNLSIKAGIGPSADTKTKFAYSYEFDNDGPEALFVFWDIPRLEEFVKQFDINSEKPLIIPPKEHISRVVNSNQIPGWGPSTILVFDNKMDLVARSIVGTWGFAEGRPSRDFNEVWSKHGK